MKTRIFNLKTILGLLLLTTITLSFASCSGDSKDTAFLDQISAAEIYSEDESSEDASSEAPTQEGYTVKPTIIDIINTSPYTAIVAGKCEEGSTIKAFNVAKEDEKYETKSIGEYFFFEVTLSNTNEHYYEISAIVEGKKESTPNHFSAFYNAVSDKPADGTAVTLGKDSALFKDSLIDSYTGKNLLTNSQIADFKASLEAITSKNEIKYVYVMIPSVLSVYDEIIPEQIKEKKDSFNTKFDQIATALAGVTNVSVINLKETFVANKNGDYPIYYNTSSNLSDYGAFLAYSEILKHMGVETIPTYKFEKVDGLGGNLVEYLGLDGEFFKENYYYATKDFVSSIPEDAEGSCKLADLVVYSDKASNKLFNIVDSSEEDTVFGANEILFFKTNRPELPSAVILRDASSNALVSMLAENLNNSYFEENGNFTLNNSEITSAISEYANEGNANVDYVFVIVNEENIDSIVGK